MGLATGMAYGKVKPGEAKFICPETGKTLLEMGGNKYVVEQCLFGLCKDCKRATQKPKLPKCECDCGYDHAQICWTDLYEPTVKYYLCMNCAIRFVNLALTAKQFFGLLRHGHKASEHMIHSDYYDSETGEALQPREGYY